MSAELYMDGLLSIFLITVFQFVATPKMSKISYWYVINKHVDYIKENNTFLKENPPIKHHVNYLLGTVLLILIIIGIYTNLSILIKVAYHLSILQFGLHSFFIDRVFAKKLSAKLPVPSIRRAALASRQITNYIPKWILASISILSFSLIICLIIIIAANKLNFAEIFKYFGTDIILIIFMTLVALFELKLSSPISSKFKISESYYRAEFSIIFIIIGARLINAYIKMAGLTFDIQILLANSGSKYIMGFISLSAFLCFVLSQSNTNTCKIK